MIKSIKGKDLKGLEFDQKLDAKTLLVGPNGSGKTAVRIAATLAISGYLPGIKKNADVLAAFGSSDKLMCGVDINGHSLNRQWSLSAKTGAVSQTYLVNTKKAKKDDFIASLATAGNPKIFDLALFMELSDARKINYIFGIYPPIGDVEEMDKAIDKYSESIRAKRSLIASGEDFIKETIATRSQMELPSGTLAETVANIEATEEKLKTAREDLQKELAARAKADAEAALLKKQEEERQEREDTAAAEAIAQQDQIKAEAPLTKSLKDYIPSKEYIDSLPDPAPYKQPEPEAPQHQRYWKGETALIEVAIHSIKAIIKAIESANCEVCGKHGFALITARRELGRWVKDLPKGENHE